jgi:hypothetical protein
MGKANPEPEAGDSVPHEKRKFVSIRPWRVFCLIFGLLSLFSLTTHAGSPAPQEATKYPWLITGHFTYVEYKVQ